MESDDGVELWSQGLYQLYAELAPPLAPPRPPGSHHHTYIHQEFPYDPLPNFVEFDTSITPNRKSIYTQALTYLSLIKDCILKGEKSPWIQHRLGIVPSVLGKNFRVLMQDEDPLS